MKQKTVIVTGASGMIGSHIVRRLADEGHRIHMLDINAERLKAMLPRLPDDTTFAETTLSDFQACVAAIEGAGDEIHGLVHMAGIFVNHDLSPESREIFDQTLQHNAVNAYDLVTAVLPRMSKGSSFVFASSLGFNRGNINQVAYTMAKGAIVGLTRALARRLAPDGIRSNAIAPGIIDTPMIEELLKSQDRDEFLKTIPMERLGQPSEMAGVVSFLLSEDASYMTGQVINVDGGMING